MKKYNNELKSVSLKYLKVFLSSISGFILSVIFIKYFSVEEFGTYSFIIQLGSAVATITSLGLSATIIRFIPEYLQKKEYNAINILIKYSILLRISSLLLVLSIILIFSKQFCEYFNQNELFIQLITLVIIFIFFNSVNPLMQNIFYTSYSKEYVNDYIEIFKILIQTFSFWLLLLYNYDLYSIVLTLVIINSIIFIGLIIKYHYITIANSENYSSINIKAFEKKRIFNYGIYNFLSGTTGFLRDISIDIFVISYYYNTEKIAFYTLGSSLAMYLSKINPNEILKNIFSPLIFKEFASKNNDIEVLKKYGIFLTKLSLFTVTPFLLLILVYAKEIIYYIYEPGYYESIIILQIFSAFYFFRIFLRTYKIFFQSLEKNKYIFITSFLGVVNLILSIILINFFNIAGVALSTGLTWLINLIIFKLILKFKLKIKISFFNKAMLKLLINIFIYIVILIIFKTYIINLLTLIMLSTTALFIYLIISRINKSFTSQERSFINSLIKYKIWKF